MSKSHPIPDWRRGAFYWRPTIDGREVTIYPLLFGAARLCIGPLADSHGYDMAFHYEDHPKAIKAADEWDPEESDMPAGFTVIETKKDDEDEAPKVGAFEKVKPDDDYVIEHQEGAEPRVSVVRYGKRGRILFAGAQHEDVDATLVVEIDTVSFNRYDGKNGPPEGQSTVSDSMREALMTPMSDEYLTVGGTVYNVKTKEGRDRLARWASEEDPRAVWPHPDNNPEPF